MNYMIRFLFLCGMASFGLSAIDIIVVGTGAAGLSGAIEAAKRGANVIVLDKTSSGGGNSAKASSGINGAETSVQAERGISDSTEAFVEDTIRVGQHLGVVKLVEKLSRESRDAINFLRDEIGLPLSDVIQLGGHSVPRTHRLSTHAPIGFSLVKALKNKLAEMSNAKMIFSAEVTGLVIEDDGDDRHVRGLSYRNANGEEVALSADAVIIASGGMAFDHSEGGLFAEFAPELKGMATSSGPQADGSGIVVARKAGAELIHMDKIQVHPTGLVDPNAADSPSKILGPETLRGTGGILVLKNGKRFVDELARRGHITQEIRSKGDDLVPLSTGREQKAAFIIMNPAAVSLFSPSMFNFYVGRGIFRAYSNAQDLCEDEGIDCENLKETLISYSASVEGVADEFGKTHFPVVFNAEESLWVAHVTPVIHYTMGGIKINDRAAVERADLRGKVIKGLYAAGEASGGVHGGDRLAGNSLLECIVFGRTAGASAVEDAQGRKAKMTEDL